MMKTDEDRNVIGVLRGCLGFSKRNDFYCYILVSLSGVKILNIVLYMSRRGVYACVCRWAICVRPRGV